MSSPTMTSLSPRKNESRWPAMTTLPASPGNAVFSRCPGACRSVCVSEPCRTIALSATFGTERAPIADPRCGFGARVAAGNSRPVIRGGATDAASAAASSDRRACHWDTPESANTNVHQPSITMPAITNRCSDHHSMVALRWCARAALSPRIVACPRSGHEPPSVACIDHDTDGAKAAVGHLRRLYTDRVSASQLARDLLERSPDVRRASWREHLAARFACQPLQYSRACVM